MPSTTATFLLPLLLIACAAPPPARRPNILLIVADDHAANALSAYGTSNNRTPHLDALAAAGMRFDRAFVTNSLCGPSRACMLTGKYSHGNGMTVNDRQPFDGSQWTLPQALHAAGYATAAIGKWHLGSTPTGFDHHDVLPGQGVYRDPAFLTMGERTRTPGYVTDVITDKAIAWLEQRPHDRPFFLYLGHKAPHRPWLPDQAHAAQWRDRTVPEPATLFDDHAGRPAAAEATMRVGRDLTETDVKMPPPDGLSGDELTRWYFQRYQQDYLACVQALDDQVGRLCEWLDAHGLGDTLVVYTSDNGFFLGEHGFYDKRFLYEESARVPLLVRWPGVVAPHSRCESMVLNVDLAATLLAAAGVAAPADLQGADFGPLLHGARPADWRQSFYYRYYEYPQPHRVQPHYGVRTATHKLIWFPALQRGELYDLAADPGELHNRFDDPACAAVQQQLQRELRRLRAALGDVD